jgi:hypothetical protein
MPFQHRSESGIVETVRSTGYTTLKEWNDNRSRPHIPGRFSFAGSVVLKEIISGTSVVGVRRYRGQKTVDLPLFTSVHSGYLGRDPHFPATVVASKYTVI